MTPSQNLQTDGRTGIKQINLPFASDSFACVRLATDEDIVKATNRLSEAFLLLSFTAGYATHYHHPFICIILLRATKATAVQRMDARRKFTNASQSERVSERERVRERERERETLKCFA